ncbi:MAG TPA: SDR family oxidoreductase [Mycobacterium sp.]|nr:SDR family oxidoreductase [Mycobacterium sp.]
MPETLKTPGKLDGKVALITGAGSGIGVGIAEAFCAEGAKVVLVDISGQQEDVAKRLGDNCLAVHADVSRASDVEAMLRAATSTFGRLDILCNNAGIDGETAAIADSSEENYDRVMAVNAKGVYLGMRYAIPIMLSGGGGSIINTASIASMVSVPMMGAYGASKGAVLMLTKSAAIEYAAQGIRVNCLCPGVIQTALIDNIPDELVEGATAMTPMRRVGRPIEMGRVAVFLASDDSSYITGAAIPVDGGYTSI